MLGGLACADPAPPDGATCPPDIVVRLNAGRDKVRAGSLLTAKLRYYEPILQNEALSSCSRDLQLKVRREYGDVLARLAKTKSGDEAREYKGKAAEVYKEYLTIYESDVQDDADRGFARVVLNAYANMTFETGAYGDLCDVLAKLTGSLAALFDANVIEKWKKCVDSANWDNDTKSARLGEYCNLFGQAGLSISRGVRVQFGGLCAAQG